MRSGQEYKNIPAIPRLSCQFTTFIILNVGCPQPTYIDSTALRCCAFNIQMEEKLFSNSVFSPVIIGCSVNFGTNGAKRYEVVFSLAIIWMDWYNWINSEK